MKSIRAIGLAAVMVGIGLWVMASPLSTNRAATARARGAAVWAVASADGAELESKGGDRSINPASVVKVATSLWALERLGPGHRFETAFGYRGTLDRETGILDGNLVVTGGGDPDFHVENAYLVARELNLRGLRQVQGVLRVDRDFWIGWEGGSERREQDGRRRAEMMASRLRDAFDPTRWDDSTRRSIDEFLKRRGLPPGDPPRLVIHGGVDLDAGSVAPQPLLTHRSNPLVRILKRFNSYSNNDIERFEVSLGSAAELAADLAKRWEVPPSRVQLQTLSGLGSNRLTPRLVVRLLRDLREACAKRGLAVADLLPMTGCDPGTLKNFPRLREGDAATALVAKTGTLAATDGGIAVLAGFVGTERGERLFCVASPGIGSGLAAARLRQERWLLELISRHGGARPAPCRDALVHSDTDVVIAAAGDRAP